jgi:hypothetical protein
MIKLVYETPESHKEFTGMHSCEIEILYIIMESFMTIVNALAAQWKL